MDERVLIVDVVGSLDFLFLLIIGGVAGLARSALGSEVNETRIIIRRVFLGSFWAMLVYLVQEAMDREDYELIPNFGWVIVIIIGAMYSNEAIDLVKSQVEKRIDKKINK